MKWLNSLNHHLFEICFQKELLCGTRKEFSVPSSKIGVPFFAPVVKIP